MTALTHPVARIAFAALGLLGVVGMGEVLRKVGVSTTVTRRLVHAGVGLFVVGTPWFFDAPAPVYALAIAFVGGNAGTRAQGWWRGTHGGRSESWGTVTFPLALIPALAATWSVAPGRTYALQIAFLVLALADPIASWVGTRLRQPGAYQLGPDEKSVAGSAALFGIALACTAGGLLLVRPSWSTGDLVGTGVAVAGAATAVEALAGRGWDNFFIIMAVIPVLLVAEREGSAFVLGGLLAGGVFGLVAYASRVLTGGGAVAAGLLAATLVAGGGWAWVGPGLAFFVLSSALSVLPDGEMTSLGKREETASARRAAQVYANGGVAWGLLLGHVAYPHPMWYTGFLGALAAAAADTWATEIGMRSSSHSWFLRTWTRVRAGTSGAISLGGTVGGLLGAASVVGAAVLTGGSLWAISWADAASVAGAGLVGMAADSIAGAFLQARYRDEDTGRLVERPTEPGAVPVRGWKGVDNEVVNGIGTTAGALAALLFL